MDIVERLRRHYPECWDAAADEIERLRAALKPFAASAADLTGYPDSHKLGCDPGDDLGAVHHGARLPGRKARI